MIDAAGGTVAGRSTATAMVGAAGWAEQLHVLAEHCGIATSYVDDNENLVEVDDLTLAALLGALDVDCSSHQAAARSVARKREAAAARCLPPVLAVEHGIAEAVTVRLPAETVSARLWVELEDGGVTGDLEIAAAVDPVEAGPPGTHVPRTAHLPAGLPLGYHTLRLTVGEERWSTHLIVSPPFLGFPAAVDKQRIWGFATQLYSVPSRNSWGMGDLADLRTLAQWSGAEHGADYLLINPINAAAPLPPIEPSPYLPVSRRFFDPQYLRVEDVPEFLSLSGADRQRCSELRARTGEGNPGPGGIDRDTAWTAKREALQLVFAAGRSADRQRDFDDFVRREGEELVLFAGWCAIAEQYGPLTSSWPIPLQDSGSPAVQQFRAAHSGAVEFHRWLQWLLDGQLAAVHRAARQVMSIGIVHDLPVGVHPAGADTWAAPSLFARSASVGAPPDAFNQLGQDWSQHPWRPDRLADIGYAPFRRLVAGILRHSGGIRIDHIIGLFRLWWIPKGSSPTAGSYVRYDADALIGIAALEAHRAGALIVGEDLGLFEPQVRQFLSRRGVPGTSVLWFEQEDDAPLPPERWREWCFASVTTHDLPPAACFVTGDHVRLRHRLGLLTDTLADELEAEEKNLAGWLGQLRRAGCVGRDPDLTEIVEGLYRYLTLTPCRLLNVALSDAVGDRQPQNVPGTTDEYPNWRHQIAGPDGRPLTLEEVLSSSSVARLAGLMSLRPAPRTDDQEGAAHVR